MAEDKKPKIDLKARLGKGAGSRSPAASLGARVIAARGRGRARSGSAAS